MISQKEFETDIIPTSTGDLSITFLGHGSLQMGYKGMSIYVDVFGEVANYSILSKADIVFLTHEHSDHMDPDALALVRTGETLLVYTEACAREIPGGIVMRNGDVQSVKGILVEAVPAYNLLHKRENGQPFHPKGAGNGYILKFEDIRVYVAGDTENIPEMQALRDISIAFLPMNLPYTMTPEMVAEAAIAFQPGILYPYHFGKTDVSRLVELLKGKKEIEVRIRKMA